jgi:hypothetical protein
MPVAHRFVDAGFVAVCSVFGADGRLVLHDATPVRLRLSRNLSSADARVGETVDFEVLDEVKIGDALVIARGETAIATITKAELKKRMARGGKLGMNINYVRLVTGDKVALRCQESHRAWSHRRRHGPHGSDGHRVLSGNPVLPLDPGEGHNDSEGD